MTDQQSPPKKRGRPPKHAGEGARPTVNFRCRTALYERLQEQALIADRSVSEEIERRLDLSFRDPDIRSMFVGGNKTADLLSMIAHVLKLARTTDGHDWSEDESLCNIVADAIWNLVVSGCSVPGAARYKASTSQSDREKDRQHALNIAHAAALLHRAIADNSFHVDEIPDPKDYVSKMNDELDGDAQPKDMLLMYPWGSK